MAYRPVAVVDDPAPCFRAGLGEELRRAGFRVESPDKPREWVQEQARLRRHTLLIASIATVADLAGFDGLDDARLTIIALVRDEDDMALHPNLLGRCHGFVSWFAQPGVIIRAAQDALAGRISLPIAVVRRLANGTSAGGWQPADVECLAMLATGTTTVRVADRFGYSEREMFRRLRALYQRLGVSGRYGAVARAVEIGLISGSPWPSNANLWHSSASSDTPPCGVSTGRQNGNHSGREALGRCSKK